MTRAARRFVLITPCGHGNLGDAAIQDTVIAQLRDRFEQPDIVAATLNPADTERRHGVRAFPLIGVSRPGYGIRMTPDDSHAATWPGILRRETRHALAAFRLLRGADALIVSGGGQLDEFWGGPWGHPFTLLKWITLARLRGVRVLVLSVGVGTLDSRAGRFFARRALALAHYRSYRDAGSKALMRAAGFTRDDPVYPDLAYGAPLPERTPHPAQQAGPLTVGVSPIVYCDPRSWPRADAPVFEAYLRRLVELIQWVRGQGHRVILFSSNGSARNSSDRGLAQELYAQVRDVAAAGPVELADTGDVASFLCVAAKSDVVVASRLHGVLLTHLTGTPVIALSHDRKVAEHMQEMDRQSLCLDIERFDLAQFQAAFRDVTGRAGDLRCATHARVDALRQRVDEQFDATLRV